MVISNWKKIGLYGLNKNISVFWRLNKIKSFAMKQKYGRPTLHLVALKPVKQI